MELYFRNDKKFVVSGYCYHQEKRISFHRIKTDFSYTYSFMFITNPLASAS
jgi:hypothetical protein